MNLDELIIKENKSLNTWKKFQKMHLKVGEYDLDSLDLFFDDFKRLNSNNLNEGIKVYERLIEGSLLISQYFKTKKSENFNSEMKTAPKKILQMRECIEKYKTILPLAVSKCLDLFNETSNLDFKYLVANNFKDYVNICEMFKIKRNEKTSLFTMKKNWNDELDYVNGFISEYNEKRNDYVLSVKRRIRKETRLLNDLRESKNYEVLCNLGVRIFYDEDPEFSKEVSLYNNAYSKAKSMSVRYNNKLKRNEEKRIEEEKRLKELELKREKEKEEIELEKRRQDLEEAVFYSSQKEKEKDNELFRIKLNAEPKTTEYVNIGNLIEGKFSSNWTKIIEMVEEEVKDCIKYEIFPNNKEDMKYLDSLSKTIIGCSEKGPLLPLGKKNPVFRKKVYSTINSLNELMSTYKQAV